MSRNDRVSIELTDLSLESVSKVFNFLEELLKVYHLDLDVFESRIKKFNLLEQYFICEYGAKFYSEQKLRSWIKDSTKYRIVDDEVVRLIHENTKDFILGIEGMRKSLRRLVANYKLENKTFKDLPTAFEEEIKDYRLPLYFVPQTLENHKQRGGVLAINKTVFRKEVNDIFIEIFTEEEIEWLFINSFDFKYNPYPVCLLYLEIQENLAKFNDRIYQLYLSYIRFYEAEKKKYETHHADHVKQIKKRVLKKSILNDKGLLVDTNQVIEITDIRKKFHPIPEEDFKLPDFTKNDFTKVLFNNFPHIREEYYKRRLKNSDYPLDTFLKSIENKIRPNNQVNK